jgi:hypothetical protein
MMVQSRDQAAVHSADVKDARRQIDVAIDRMTKLLDEVEEQATQAKEHLDERRAG